MTMLRTIFVSLGLLALAGCTQPTHVADSAYYNHGGPEQLLDVSSEVVNLSIATPAQAGDLTRWIHQDHPTRAELYCTEGDARCRTARHILDSNGVSVMMVPSGDFTVALVYERVVARDCDQRYHDDSHDYLLYNHADFGCSVSANIVQQVSDKQEFVAPNLMDVPPASGAVSAYQRAYAPPPVAAQPAYSLQQSTLDQAAQAGGGGGQ